MPTAETKAALGRAGKRAAIHLVQALIEGLKAVEAVIDEIARIGDSDHHDNEIPRQRIEVE